MMSAEWDFNVSATNSGIQSDLHSTALHQMTQLNYTEKIWPFPQSSHSHHDHVIVVDVVAVVASWCAHCLLPHPGKQCWQCWQWHTSPDHPPVVSSSRRGDIIHWPHNQPPEAVHSVHSVRIMYNVQWVGEWLTDYLKLDEANIWSWKNLNPKGSLPWKKTGYLMTPIIYVGGGLKQNQIS